MTANDSNEVTFFMTLNAFFSMYFNFLISCPKITRNFIERARARVCVRA